MYGVMVYPGKSRAGGFFSFTTQVSNYICSSVIHSSSTTNTLTPLNLPLSAPSC